VDRAVGVEIEARSRTAAAPEDGELHVQRPVVAHSIPVKHTTGRYYAPPDVLNSLDAHGQIVLKYAHDGNPNGSSNDIAGVRNEAGNVFGLMPHPEHAVDELTGSTDGLKIFTSMAHAHADA